MPKDEESFAWEVVMAKKSSTALMNRPTEVKEKYFRVEENIADFISLRMPTISGANTIDIKPLWTSKSGKSKYFRVNYWRDDRDYMILSRTYVSSRFVRIDTLPDGTMILENPDKK